jgi:hypothetical protein
MKMVLVGVAPAVAWVKDFAERAITAVESPQKPQLIVVQAAPTREHLASLLSEPIDALILADHALIVATSPETPSRDATRAEAQRAVLAIELSRRAMRTLVLERREAKNWPTSLAMLLSQLLEAEAAHECATWPSWLEVPAPAPGLLEMPLATAYLQPLFAAAVRSAPLTFTWPRESFLDGDAPGETLPAVVEVAGRARILAYGPYLPLPSGSWRAVAFLGFSPDIGKMPFILEAEVGGAVSRGFFEADRGGFFELELDFQVEDAMNPIEFRLISQDSALEGQLSLLEVQLEQKQSHH